MIANFFVFFLNQINLNYKPNVQEKGKLLNNFNHLDELYYAYKLSFVNNFPEEYFENLLKKKIKEYFKNLFEAFYAKSNSDLCKHPDWSPKFSVKSFEWIMDYLNRIFEYTGTNFLDFLDEIIASDELLEWGLTNSRFLIHEIDKINEFLETVLAHLECHLIESIGIDDSIQAKQFYPKAGAFLQMMLKEENRKKIEKLQIYKFRLQSIKFVNNNKNPNLITSMDLCFKTQDDTAYIFEKKLDSEIKKEVYSPVSHISLSHKEHFLYAFFPKTNNDSKSNIFGYYSIYEDCKTRGLTDAIKVIFDESEKIIL